jgi:hypothetical protein
LTRLALACPPYDPTTEIVASLFGRSRSKDADEIAAQHPDSRPVGTGLGRGGPHPFRSDAPLSEATVVGLQHWVGNRTVEAMLRSATVQRHPPGAGLSVDVGAAVAEPDVVPAAATAAPASTRDAGTADRPAGAEQAPGAAPAAEGGVFGWVTNLFKRVLDGGTPAPAPAKPAYLDLATAQTVLEKQYGASKKITSGNIEFLDSKEAAWAKYDELCVAGNVQNPKTGELWKAGDAQTAYPFGLNGFNWKGTSYINKESALATTTPHEMLHGNTAEGFRAAVGETLNEGCTQWLAVQALKASNIAVPASLPYAQEVSVAQALVDLVGEAKVKDAYFLGGANIAVLKKAVDDVMGDGTFDQAKTAGDAKDFAKARGLLSTAGMGDLAPLGGGGGVAVA